MAMLSTERFSPLRPLQFTAYAVVFNVSVTSTQQLSGSPELGEQFVPVDVSAILSRGVPVPLSLLYTKTLPVAAVGFSQKNDI